MRALIWRYDDRRSGVGHLPWFRDIEGNVAGAMQYDSGARVAD